MQPPWPSWVVPLRVQQNCCVIPQFRSWLCTPKDWTQGLEQTLVPPLPAWTAGASIVGSGGRNLPGGVTSTHGTVSHQGEGRGRSGANRQDGGSRGYGQVGRARRAMRGHTALRRCFTGQRNCPESQLGALASKQPLPLSVRSSQGAEDS